jgi:transcription termination/antitermination protein NusA
MADDVAMQTPDEEPSELFVRVLAVDRAVAELLVANEITTLEEVAYVPENELHSIEGLDHKLIALMRQRARNHLLRDVMGRQ